LLALYDCEHAMKFITALSLPLFCYVIGSLCLLACHVYHQSAITCVFVICCWLFMSAISGLSVQGRWLSIFATMLCLSIIMPCLSAEAYWLSLCPFLCVLPF